jgi:hypothetical protein
MLVSVLVLSGAGCQHTQPTVVVPEIRERKIEVPKSILECAPEPRLTADLIEKLRALDPAGDGVSLFINQLAAAGADCRAKLKAVKRYLATQ